MICISQPAKFSGANYSLEQAFSHALVRLNLKIEHLNQRLGIARGS